MGWLGRAIGGMIRMIFAIGLIAFVLLIGLSYLDGTGVAQGKVNAALADTVGPRVASAVEAGGNSLLSQAGDMLRNVLRQADEVLGSQLLASDASGTEQGEVFTPSAESRALLEMINGYRVSEGLNPWRWDDRLAAFAQTRADDMIARNYFSHHDPETGEILLARLPTLVSVGENLFQVSGPAVRFMRNVNDEVLKGWQNSPSHNELLLAPRMTRGGIAFARVETRIVAVLIAGE